MTSGIVEFISGLTGQCWYIGNCHSIVDWSLQSSLPVSTKPVGPIARCVIFDCRDSTARTLDSFGCIKCCSVRAQVKSLINGVHSYCLAESSLQTFSTFPSVSRRYLVAYLIVISWIFFRNHIRVLGIDPESRHRTFSSNINIFRS